MEDSKQAGAYPSQIAGPQTTTKNKKKEKNKEEEEEEEEGGGGGEDAILQSKLNRQYFKRAGDFQ